MSISDKSQQRGGIVLLVLLMLLVFTIIATASLRFIVRQSNQAVLQEQEEQAFGIADAGVNYVLWLLSGTGGNFTPLQLVAAPPSSTQNHPVTDTASQKVGEFDLYFGPACSDYVEFRSVGYDLLKTNLCQVVDGKAQLFTNGEYKIVKWNHLVGYQCNQTYLPPSPAPCGSPLPSPSVSPTPSFSPLPSPSSSPTTTPLLTPSPVATPTPSPFSCVPPGAACGSSFGTCCSGFTCVTGFCTDSSTP